MRLPIRLAASLFATCLVFTAAIPAFADDFGKRITINLIPEYITSGTGDSTAPPPPGFVPVGYTQDHPVPSDLRLDYGASLRLDKKTSLNYSHSTLDFAIGRVLTIAPGESFTFGTFVDRTDTIGLNRVLAKGLSAHLNYFNHQRSDVTGLCLNQIACPNAAGQAVNNPSSINEHGYDLGLGYSFGPKTKIGNLLSAGIDAKYVPRSDTTVNPNLGGLGKYVGSQVMFPYSIASKIPILNSETVIPVIAYSRAAVLYQNEATPETYNIVSYGITKEISKNAALAIENLNIVGCRCSDTVPPPDNVRFDVIQVKLELKTQL